MSVADIELAIQSSYPFKVSDLPSDFGEMVDSVSTYIRAFRCPFFDSTVLFYYNVVKSK